MTRVKGITAIIGLTVLMAVAVACGNGEVAASPGAGTSPASTGNTPLWGDVAATQQQTPSSDLVTTVATETVGKKEPSIVVAAVEPSAGVTSAVSSQPVQSVNSQTGIWVTGEGTVSIEPDLALLNVGVEATAKTVGEALCDAATAMDAVVAALHARGIEDKDIQTRFFNISPRYEWVEVVQEGIRSSKQVLVGYMVSNSTAIKIRDLDAVGAIIDEVATAGGDATRINGIRFTVEDTKPLMAGLREQAVEDAFAKAQHFARLAGVNLGSLVFISETGGGSPEVRDFAVERAFAQAAPAPSTGISGGELELRLGVQAVYGIQ